MKIRTDFVSNSSSSSFIIICNNNDDSKNILKAYEDDILTFPNENGKCQFGWEFDYTYSFEGKLNFVGILLLSLYIMKDNPNSRSKYRDKFDELYQMTKRVCKQHANIDVELNLGLIESHKYADSNGNDVIYKSINHNFYIDHQSCVTEDSCMEMFESDVSLTNFLFDANSYIEGGNDNE